MIKSLAPTLVQATRQEPLQPSSTTGRSGRKLACVNLICVIYCAILDIYTHKPTKGNSNVDVVISDDNDVVISDDDFDNYPPWSEENQRSVEFHFHVHNTIHAWYSCMYHFVYPSVAT